MGKRRSAVTNGNCSRDRGDVRCPLDGLDSLPSPISTCISTTSLRSSAGNGLPYEFASGEESGLVEANVSSPTAVSFGPIGAQHPFTGDYPAANALVTFR